MIYEIRTYQVKVGSLAEVEKRYGEGYEHRKKYSPLTAFWHTEVGPLNEIIHVWGYKDLAERARVRAEAAKDANWPPKIQEFIQNMQVEVIVPFPFTTELLPGTMGPIFEMRYYTIRAGRCPTSSSGGARPSTRAPSCRRWPWPATWSSARPTATTTCGRIRAWSTARPSGRKRARRASGRRPAAATSS